MIPHLHSYEHSSPGCLVADIRRPEGGLALPVWLRSEGATIPVIFIFRHGDVAMAVQAGQAGAFDLIEKPFSDELLLDRIQKALEHDRKTRQDER
jgi:FixJ family two-component response regulator